MIRAVDHHPQANVLTRSHAEWRHQRFQGTEADSTFTPVCEAPDEADSGWPTTRKFARSMHSIDSAFPNSPEYADPFARFEHHLSQDKPAESKSWKWAVRCVYLIAVFVGIGLYRGWLK